MDIHIEKRRPHRSKCTGTGACECPVRWDVRWREPSGKRCSKSFNRKREADAKKIDVEKALKDRTYTSVDDEAKLFADFIEAWFRRQQHLAGATRDRDESHIRKHLVPRWGRYKLSEIRMEAVEDWALELAHQYAHKTVLDIYGIFRRAMESAHEHHFITYSPIPRKINLPRNRVKKKPVFIEDEDAVWRLADCMPPYWRAWVLTATYMGLRPGECHGIRVVDVALETGWLTVQGAVKEHGNEQPYWEGVTKDEKVWRKPIPSFLIEVLADHMKRFPHEDYVFTTAQGHLIRKGNFYRVWYKALQKAGLERMTPHTLRHTCSSLLDAKGVSVKERMDYVGHSTVRMQMHYTHTRALNVFGVWPLISIVECVTVLTSRSPLMTEVWPKYCQIGVVTVRKVTSER